MYFEIKTKYKLYIDKFIPLGTGVYIQVYIQVTPSV